MEEALAIFVTVADDALARLVDESMKTSVQLWLMQLQVYNVHFIFRPDFKEMLDEAILGNETVRNYLLEVQFRFYALAGDGAGFIQGVCDNLEDALLLEGRIPDFNALPEDISASAPSAFFKGNRQSSNWFARHFQRFLPPPSEITLREFLLSNPIYVTVLLLYLTADDMTPPSEGTSE
jgi:hypothetical protein